MNYLSNRFSTVIIPPAGPNCECPSKQCPFYGCSNKEFVRIALGEHFTTSIKKEANISYDDWINNLNKMVSCGMINRFMMMGFLDLDMYHRSTSNDSSSDTEDTSTTTQVRVYCGHVHTY